MGRWASYPARIMMQFVFTDALKNAINPNRITEAKLYLWDQSTDTTRRDVNVRVPKNIWTASTITWNNNPGYYDSSWNGVARPAPHTISGDPGWWAYPYMRDLVSAMLRNYQDTSLPRTLHEKRGIMIKLENESVGLKTLRSSNHSENRPNMSITYTVPYKGSAGAYRSRTGSICNCWGYAIKLDQYIGPAFKFYENSSRTLSVSEASALISEYPTGKSLRKINNYDSAILSDEHRIAFKIRLSTHYETSYGAYVIDDYHFITQHNNGWAHKNGSSSSIDLGNITPSNNASYWTDYVSGSDMSVMQFYAVS